MPSRETFRSWLDPRRLRPSFAMVALAALMGALYIASPVLQSSDGRLVVYEADSLIKERNLDLSEFGAITNGFPCYRVGAKTISRYPWGAAIVAVPFVGALEGLGAIVGHDPSDTFKERAAREFEKTVAAVIAAFALLAMMQLVRMLTGRLAPALLAGVVFGVGSAMWSVVSRGLWQHGPLMLVLSLGLITLLHAHRRDRLWAYGLAGFLMASSFSIRPTAAIAIVAVGLVALWWSRRGAVVFGVAAALTGGLILLVNLHEYDSVMNPFYFPPGGASFIGTGLRPSFWNGLAGTTISPARGLLPSSPFLILAALAPLLLRRRPTALEVASYATIVLIWASVANTLDWPGGWSYGPRLLTDLFPFFVVILAPLFDLVTKPGWTSVRSAQFAVVVLVVGTLFGAFVNGRGAFSWATQLWNMGPPPADFRYTNDRYFDWGDAPFLRTGPATQQSVYPWDGPAALAPGTACLET